MKWYVVVLRGRLCSCDGAGSSWGNDVPLPLIINAKITEKRYFCQILRCQLCRRECLMAGAKFL
jgi:hypothetical protein